MTKERWRVYLLVVGLAALITTFAFLGLRFTFQAADDARHLGKELKCQNLVIGEYIHKFHVNMAIVESFEHSPSSRAKILREIANEPDLKSAMNNC